MSYVIKRSGKKEAVKFDKVTARIQKLSYGLSDMVNVIDVAKKTIEGIYAGVHTIELDNLAAEVAASMTTLHPDYAILASRIAVSNLHKNTIKSFSHTVQKLYEYTDMTTGRHMPLIADDVMQVINDHADILDSTIIYDRDYGFDYFGFKTLERSYLLRINGAVAERPQHMYMRVAVGIHKDDIESVIKNLSSDE
jgi:ribonucleoside-diphosphate reductase alpha chain